ncbi:hypothetical protein G7Y79_00001g000890 [Physcia stellaris]|nr:hypothetical protein G7Y79_00001g000890 [Physcia stellaris]
MSLKTQCIFQAHAAPFPFPDLSIADIGQTALILLLGSLIAWTSFRLGGYHQMREISKLRATAQENVEQMLREELTPVVRNQLLEEERQDVRDMLEAREREGVSALVKQRLFIAGAGYGMRGSYKRGKRDGWEEVMGEMREVRRRAHGGYSLGRARRTARRGFRSVDAEASDGGGEEFGGYRRQEGQGTW